MWEANPFITNAQRCKTFYGEIKRRYLNKDYAV